MSGPLSAVLDAFRCGAASTAEVAARTGLDRSVVGAAVDHLVRMGRLEASMLELGCPDGGCGTCPAASGTCSSVGTPRRGLVALSLSRVAHAGA